MAFSKLAFLVCRMSQLLDELSVLSEKVKDLDVSLLDKKVDQMMPELGFSQDDNDRLVASYRCTAPNLSDQVLRFTSP